MRNLVFVLSDELYEKLSSENEGLTGTKLSEKLSREWYEKYGIERPLNKRERKLREKIEQLEHEYKESRAGRNETPLGISNDSNETYSEQGEHILLIGTTGTDEWNDLPEQW